MISLDEYARIEYAIEERQPVPVDMNFNQDDTNSFFESLLSGENKLSSDIIKKLYFLRSD